LGLLESLTRRRCARRGWQESQSARPRFDRPTSGSGVQCTVLDEPSSEPSGDGFHRQAARAHEQVGNHLLFKGTDEDMDLLPKSGAEVVQQAPASSMITADVATILGDDLAELLPG
jgi:hypothetical protein